MPRKTPRLAAFFFVAWLWMWLPQPVLAQDATPTPELAATPGVGDSAVLADGIEFPQQKAVLSGVVDIRGTALAAWDLSFAYKDDPSGTWFTLSGSSAAVNNALLASWDTNTITAGSYTLRLRVFDEVSPREILLVVSISHQPPVEASATAPEPTRAPRITPTLPAQGTPFLLAAPDLPLPSPVVSARRPNPAVLNSADILLSAAKGMLAVAALFAFTGMLRFLFRKK